jgi:hypothetical protein
MKNAVILDVAPCVFNINRCFGGTCSLHLHGRITRGRKIVRRLLIVSGRSTHICALKGKVEVAEVHVFVH